MGEDARHPVVTNWWAADIAREMTTCFGMDEGLDWRKRRSDRDFLGSGLFLKEWCMNNSNQTGTTLERLRRDWAVMTFYERFEQAVAIILSAVIAVIILVSLVQLIQIVFSLLIIDAFNPLDHKIFQTVFGMIMTLLIAMEFKHSIVRVALRRDSIIQVKTVILIGLIALSRKFVILDPDVGPAKVAALAGATLALGLTYWLLRERDDRIV